jgi:hypothetical protein
MSNPYSSPHAPQYYQPPQENTLGLVGFIASLIGLFFCVAAPVGLIISLMGLRQHPKGFAIAGTIIGGVTTLLYLAVLAMYGAFLAACIGVGVAAQPMVQTMATLGDARQTIENAIGPDGAYPGQAEGDRLIAGKTDYWQNALRYEPTDGGFVIRSAGADKQFNTTDDLTVDDFGNSFGMPDVEMPDVEMPDAEMPDADESTIPLERDEPAETTLELPEETAPTP